jgi:hypothetical protein
VIDHLEKTLLASFLVVKVACHLIEFARDENRHHLVEVASQNRIQRTFIALHNTEEMVKQLKPRSVCLHDWNMMLSWCSFYFLTLIYSLLSGFGLD